MNATARKPPAVKLELEAEISNLSDHDNQKLPAQIDDDGERIRSLVAKLTSNSVDELDGLGSDLTSAVRQLQEFLKSEGERVQREIVNYAHLTETTVAAIKNIIETTFRSAAERQTSGSTRTARLSLSPARRRVRKFGAVLPSGSLALTQPRSLITTAAALSRLCARRRSFSAPLASTRLNQSKNISVAKRINAAESH